MKKQNKYKYDCPRHWLRNKARTAFMGDNIDWLFRAVLELSYKLDNDTIQEVFEKEMDADGYFEEEE